MISEAKPTRIRDIPRIREIEEHRMCVQFRLRECGENVFRREHGF